MSSVSRRIWSTPTFSAVEAIPLTEPIMVRFCWTYTLLGSLELTCDRSEPGLGNGDSLAAKAYPAADLAQRRYVIVSEP